MSSKHPVKMYEKTSTQLLATSDPMVIFCQPNSTWVDFFIQNRKHAPTVVVPLDANELRLVKHFPRDTFWKKQYEIDPEAPTHHKGVNTMLYVIWDEKLVLLHSAAMLNPFNSTQFVWVDTGYWRNPGENRDILTTVQFGPNILLRYFQSPCPHFLCSASFVSKKCSNDQHYSRRREGRIDLVVSNERLQF
jgi:hypothetical protein